MTKNIAGKLLAYLMTAMLIFTFCLSTAADYFAIEAKAADNEKLYIPILTGLDKLSKVDGKNHYQAAFDASGNIIEYSTDNKTNVWINVVGSLADSKIELVNYNGSYANCISTYNFPSNAQVGDVYKLKLVIDVTEQVSGSYLEFSIGGLKSKYYYEVKNITVGEHTIELIAEMTSSGYNCTLAYDGANKTASSWTSYTSNFVRNNGVKAYLKDIEIGVEQVPPYLTAIKAKQGDNETAITTEAISSDTESIVAVMSGKLDDACINSDGIKLYRKAGSLTAEVETEISAVGNNIYIKPKNGFSNLSDYEIRMLADKLSFKGIKYLESDYTVEFKVKDSLTDLGIDSAGFKINGGDAISADGLRDGGTLDVSITLGGAAGGNEHDSGVIIIAIYDGDKLVAMQAITTDKGETSNFGFSSLSPMTSPKVECYLMDSYTTCIPLSNALSIN